MEKQNENKSINESMNINEDASLKNAVASEASSEPAEKSDCSDVPVSSEVSSSSLPNEDIELEEAREKLIEIIKEKSPSAASDFIVSSLSPVVSGLSASDCRNMADIIEEKGLVGALMLGKKMKKKIQKNGEDPNQGRVE